MSEQDILQTVLSDSAYRLSLFDPSDVADLRARAFTKIVRGRETPYVKCIVRDREVQLKPEEVVRQLYAARLMHHYGYPKARLAFEHVIPFGREKKRADIVITDKDRPGTPYAVVEIKKPRLRDGKGQLRSYCKRHRRAHRRLDQRRANLPLPPQRPQLFRGYRRRPPMPARAWLTSSPSVVYSKIPHH